MPIFRRDPEEPSPSPDRAEPHRQRPRSSGSDAPARQETLIAAGSKVIGEILGSTPVRVAGELGGRIRVEATVRVEQEGAVEGDVEARAVFVGGRVTGNVRGAEKIVLEPTGHLEGDVRAPRVIIEEGAFLKGEVEMGSDSPSPAARRQDRREAKPTSPQDKPSTAGKDSAPNGPTRNPKPESTQAGGESQ